MNYHTPGSVLGIKHRTPLAKLNSEKLQELWAQMTRNRDLLEIIKMLEGIIPATTRAQKRLQKIHSLLLMRGCDPLRT